MAGSRVEKLSTIFKRYTGLLKSGAVLEENRPIWYDIYKQFPPQVEPLAIRPTPTQAIRPIFYQEDILRARFYTLYGNQAMTHDSLTVSSDGKLNACDLFIAKVAEMSSNIQQDINDGQFLTNVEKSLHQDCGLKLRRLRSQS